MKKSLLPTPRTGKNFLVPRANKDRKVSSLVSSLGGKKGKPLRTDTSMSLPAPRTGPTLGAGPSVSGGAPDLFNQPPPGTNGMPRI